jgi:hypothetical protein
MHFDLTLNLQFDDGTSLDYTFQELTVSEILEKNPYP